MSTGQVCIVVLACFGLSFADYDSCSTGIYGSTQGTAVPLPAVKYDLTNYVVEIPAAQACQALGSYSHPVGQATKVCTQDSPPTVTATSQNDSTVAADSSTIVYVTVYCSNN